MQQLHTVGRQNNSLLYGPLELGSRFIAKLKIEDAMMTFTQYLYSIE